MNDNEISMECGPTYVIKLRPVISDITGVTSDCLFSGSIEGDQYSHVAAYGCPGGQDTTVSIASYLVEDGQIDLQAQSEHVLLILLIIHNRYLVKQATLLPELLILTMKLKLSQVVWFPLDGMEELFLAHLKSRPLFIMTPVFWHILEGLTVK